MNQTCKRAVKKFGVDNQIIKAVEELSELIVALLKYRDKRINERDVIDEIADVKIMCEQLTVIFGADKIDRRTEEKLDRLKMLLKINPDIYNKNRQLK